MWWTRREFFKGSAAAVAGARGLSPALGLAEHVPDQIRQALMPRIDREVDAKQRLTLIRQAEAVMEQDPPLVPVAREKINDVWYNYVKATIPTNTLASRT